MKLDQKAYVFDLDGCIYQGDEIIPGAEKVLQRLRDQKKKILFLTNNSTGTPFQYAIKLRKLGIEASPDEILTSAIATALYMRRLRRGGVYVIGEAPLKEEISKQGFSIINAEETEAIYVVSGLDRQLTYDKVSLACKAIFNGARYIATNADPVLPTPQGLKPGAGAVIGMISAVTSVKPIVVGKPSRIIIDLALKMLSTKASETTIVGDGLGTDVLAGKRAGLFTVLVLSGVSGKRELKRSPFQPDLVVKSIRDLERYI